MSTFIKENVMPEEKLTPSILYTTEAEESKKKSEEELNVPDPDEKTAESAIEANSCGDNTDKDK